MVGLCVCCISKRLAEKGFKNVPVWFCGTEPLEAMHGDPGDCLDILRNWYPYSETNEYKNRWGE